MKLKKLVVIRLIITGSGPLLGYDGNDRYLKKHIIILSKRKFM